MNTSFFIYIISDWKIETLICNSLNAYLSFMYINVSACVRINIILMCIDLYFMYI